MQTPYPFVPDGKLAYIRQIDIDTLPDDIRSQIPGGVEVWGVHSDDGECIALTQDRPTAFFVAREHDLEPVSAH
ncbi:DUF1150 family protein [Rhodobacter sp. NTK016B]|uniref:DUF1150 domain-containing protein n=1 Tax=Pararhodobacter marinus TaxID=2184063 RepID=A0A2U2CCG6_9RHOB|nr:MULTISPECIES: DUF1150 family protein [Paracoccaceae]MBN8293633.1 DUF1150 family protein [Rhodobacter sp. NTK016B]PWE29585.1 DUF1150 domain-containing protein [Pararhodobacter marinus]